MNKKTAAKVYLLEALRTIIHEEVGEAIRQTGGKHFDLNFFKSLKTAYEAADYAEGRLEDFGEGSSRKVFLLSSGKVLKIAYGRVNAGKAQNEEEVSVFTNPKSRAVVAKVFDFDPSFRWIVSELVKPLDNVDYISSRFGINSDELEEILSAALDSTGKNWKNEIRNDMYKDIVKPGYRNGNAWYNGLPVPRVSRSETMSIISKASEDDDGLLILPQAIVKAMKKELALRKKEFELEWEKTQASFGRLEEFISGVQEMQKTIGFSTSDISGRSEHLGITSDNRLVILDYGFSQEISNKFYRGFHSQSDEKLTGHSSDGWSGDSEGSIRSDSPDSQSSQLSNSGRSGSSR